jgi:hypothetical protein
MIHATDIAAWPHDMPAITASPTTEMTIVSLPQDRLTLRRSGVLRPADAPAQLRTP